MDINLKSAADNNQAATTREQWSPQVYARTGGAAYLIIIVAGFIGECSFAIN